MAALSLVTIPDERLRQRAAPVERFAPDLRARVRQMMQAMEAEGGVGLAGPQVGVMERVFVMRIRPDDERLPAEHPLAGKAVVLVNPVVEHASAEQEEGMEACLSIPGYAGLVKRHRSIVMVGRNEWGKAQRFEVDGFVARVMQHELDHLDGILFLDRLEGDDKLFKVVKQEGGEPAKEPTPAPPS